MRRQVSVASTASRHSADKEEFTTRFIRLLSQQRSENVPAPSTRKIRKPPWEPLSWRLARLASQKHTSPTDESSRSFGNIRSSVCPLIFLTTLFAWCTSATVALATRPPNMQFSNEMSGQLWVDTHLIWPMRHLSSEFSPDSKTLFLSSPSSPVFISFMLLMYSSREILTPWLVSLTWSPRYLKQSSSSVPTLNTDLICGIISCRKCLLPPYKKSSTWTIRIPQWLLLHWSSQMNTDRSLLDVLAPSAVNSFWTLIYHFRPASAIPYGVFISFHNLSDWASFGGCRYISRAISFPWRYALLISMDCSFHFFAARMLINIRRDSFEQVGLSVRSWDLSSSNPRATRWALVTRWPPFIFSVQTHLVEILGCPVSGTSTYVLNSFHFSISACLASRNRELLVVDPK